MHCGSRAPARKAAVTDFFSQVITACGAFSSAFPPASIIRPIWLEGLSGEDVQDGIRTVEDL